MKPPETIFKKEALKERNQFIAETRQNGEYSIGELAKMFGISRERVRQIANECGVDPVHAKNAYKAHKKEASSIADREECSRLLESKSELLRDYIDGYGPGYLAEKYGCRPKNVRKVLDEIIDNKVIAERSNSLNFGKRYDEPLYRRTSESDLYWSRERCLEKIGALVESHGEFPTIEEYNKITKTGNYPSFSTLRNRVGRWSYIKILFSGEK